MLIEKRGASDREQLCELFYTLSTRGIPMERKITQLRRYEDHLLQRDVCWVREAKLALLRDLLWLMYNDKLDLLESALRDRHKLEKEATPSSLVKAADFALGGISDKEASDIMELMRIMRADGMGGQELPFM